MDFHVTIYKQGEDEVKVFEQYADMIRFIDTNLAYWNNFDSHLILDISVKKVKSDTDTIGVNANDIFNLSENIS